MTQEISDETAGGRLEIEQQVRDVVEVDFQKTAREIVLLVQASLASTFLKPQQRVLAQLEKQEINAIASDLTQSFLEKKMGLKELTSMARKAVAMMVIKKSVPKYRAALLDGDVGPVEYFNRFYKDHFVSCGIPANGISTIDPNLHLYLKRRKEFSDVTRSLGK